MSLYSHHPAFKHCLSRLTGDCSIIAELSENLENTGFKPCRKAAKMLNFVDVIILSLSEDL
jgi:hypothetical protein